MFQTEPIIWLQSLAFPALTWLMTGVTTLGYTPVYIVLVLTLAFGVRLRPTLVVLVAILLSGILTASLKDGLAFPRPSSIDVRVGEPGDPSPPLDVVDRGGAPDFWSLPTDEARAAFRALEPDSYGFPSGHVSTATAFLVALALAFRRKSILAFAASWVPLMALSRMYLGRHFLADVLGGVAVGLVGVSAALLLLRSFEQDTSLRPRALRLAPLSSIAVVLVVLTALVPVLDAENVGRLVGVVASYGLLTATGFPSDDGSLWQRGGRVLCGVLLFAAAMLVVSLALEITGLEDTRTGTLLGSGLGTAAALGGAIATSRGLRLYAPAPPGERGTS